MSPEKPVGRYVGGTWVTIAPEELGSGSRAEIKEFVGRLVGPHSINVSAFETVELQGPDELRDPFEWYTGDPIL